MPHLRPFSSSYHLSFDETFSFLALELQNQEPERAIHNSHREVEHMSLSTKLTFNTGAAGSFGGGGNFLTMSAQLPPTAAMVMMVCCGLQTLL